MSVTDVSPKPPRREREYLGDGVYARFDGFQIWVELSDGQSFFNPVALNGDTLAALDRYRKQFGL